MIKIKICGITNLEDALFCSENGADALGFIFSKKSPRYINESQADRIISRLDPFINTVGVFLDEERGKVFEIAERLNLDILQFHGQESPAYCDYFRQKFKVIKVFFPENKPLKREVPYYKVDAYLFDIKREHKIQGKTILSGSSLAEIAAFIKEGRQVIISGGLGVKNIAQVIKLKPYAVDIASGLEELVGKKDKDLVRLFIQKVKYGTTR
jgi:phosphoribosylanthranilate isomerase